MKQCRDLCEKAVSQRAKLDKQLEKWKDKKATLLAEKSCLKKKDASADKTASEKDVREALKKNKAGTDACRDNITKLGEDLLLDLVKVMQYKGALKEMIQTTYGFEAGMGFKQFAGLV